MSSHSKSAAIIGLDSSMGFNHAALMFGGHSRHSKKMSISSKKRQSSPRLLTKKVLDPELEDVDMTPPEERLAKFSVLAVEYEERHDFEQLVTARMHCLALAQLCFGKTHPEVTLSHLRLGNAFQRRGLFVQAEQHAQTALDRLTSIDHGEKESKRIRFGALSTVGCAGIGLRQWAKAEPLLQQAQDLVEYASGASDKANLMLALSQVQTQKRYYGDAVETLESALAEKLKIVSETHPDMLAFFLQLGRAYHRLSTTAADQPNPLMSQKAVEVLTKAVNVGVVNNFVFKQEMGDAMFYLGASLAESGKAENAIEYFERSLKVYRTLHGKRSAPVARTLRQIAFLFIRQRNLDSAIPYLAAVIKAESHLHGPNSVQVGDLLKTRGDVLLIAQRYDEAIASLTEAASVYETVFGSDCQQRKECHDRIARADEIKYSE